MPIYEYKCPNCGERFEVRQAMGEDGSSLSCPKCHAPSPERLFSSFFKSGSNDAGAMETSCPTCSSGVCGLPPMM